MKYLRKKSFLPTFGSWGLGAGFCFFLFSPWSIGAEESAALKYTYRPEMTQISILHDIKGKVYLPLMEVAKFYGLDVQFDSQTRRVSLSKGKNLIKLALSQPVFMTFNPEASYPVDPAEVVSGQLGISPEAAEDLVGTLLNINVRFLPEQQTLIAGGIRADEIKKEILAEVQKAKNPPVPPKQPTIQVQSPGPLQESGEEQDDKEAPSLPAPQRIGENAPSERQVYRVRRIIIDPGHGGRDCGARGFDKKYCEKEAAFKIAQRVAELLRENSDQKLEIFMTRTSDYFISLKYRCEFANRHNGDVFVSIHCNSNPKSKSTGTETYYYSPRPSNRVATLAAARENGVNSDLGSLLADLHQGTYKTRSQRLAFEVHRLIRDRLKQHIRHVQHAPFYVLRQVDMPSILVETAFISNPKEEVKLRDPYWRDHIAKSIADGILAYRDIVESTSENQQARR